MRLKAGIVTLILVIAGFTLIKKGAELTSGKHIIRARLSDVRGMPVGAPVTLAGLKVGTIVQRRVGSGYAEIDIQFASRIDLRRDATLFKRRTSLLSGPSLEIDPGQSKEPLPGKYILHVVETSAIGDILYEISDALPAVRQKSEEGVLRAENFRARVGGPFKDRVVEMDRATQDIQERMHNRLSKMDEALKVGENLKFDARASIEPPITRSEELTALARDSLSQARAWVVKSAARSRQAVDDSQIDWSPYADPIREIDEGEGTLGELLNNPELHDDIAEVTKKTRSFVRSIVNWQMRVGLRAEYAMISGDGRAYVTVKAGRTDRYYYLEIEQSSDGGSPKVKVVYDQNLGTWRRELSIKNEVRLTAQFARRLGPAVLRYGLKESSFGAGADVELIDKRLELSADVFEFGLADRPRLKLAMTYRFFGQLYVLAGLDNVLNPGRNYNVAPQATDVPQTLADDIYVGRDYFFGASLRFSDRDLAQLLRIGGDALATLASP